MASSSIQLTIVILLCSEGGVVGASLRAPPCNKVKPHVADLHDNAISKGQALADLHISGGSLSDVQSITKAAESKLFTDRTDHHIPEYLSKEYDAEIEKAKHLNEDAGKDSAKVQELIESMDTVKSGQQVPRELALSVRAESHAAAKEKKEAQNVDQETLELHRENVDVTGDMYGRVWFACQGPKVARDPLLEHTGIDIVNNVMCTDEFTFKSLCCARWKDEDFKYESSLKLKSSQEAVPEKDQPKGNTIKLCTQAVNGVYLLSKAAKHSSTHAANARMPVECFVQDVSMNDLREGAALQLRAAFFKSQQIPESALPTCAKEVKKCPDGKPPASPSEAFLQKDNPLAPRKGAMKNLLTLEEMGVNMNMKLLNPIRTAPIYHPL